MWEKPKHFYSLLHVTMTLWVSICMSQCVSVILKVLLKQLDNNNKIIICVLYFTVFLIASQWSIKNNAKSWQVNSTT